MKRQWSRLDTGLIFLALLTEFFIADLRGACVAAAVVALFFAATRGYLKFLISKPTLWLGAISYSLYLIHRNLGYEVLDWLNAHHVDVAVALPLTILGALALASAFTYGVEQPALARIRRWYEGRNVAQGVETRT
ncbi:MAG TPA: hypothetical protein VET48_01560, partial [Steroidobacteraceae bacterium]|nr:hypothetical protein [Steroidobacteraceae bacterium]